MSDVIFDCRRSVLEIQDDRRSAAVNGRPRVRQYSKHVCCGHLTSWPQTNAMPCVSQRRRNNGAAATTPTNDKSSARCVLITWLKNEMIYRSPPSPRPSTTPPVSHDRLHNTRADRRAYTVLDESFPSVQNYYVTNTHVRIRTVTTYIIIMANAPSYYIIIYLTYALHVLDGHRVGEKTT